jgi:hypothetical protein
MVRKLKHSSDQSVEELEQVGLESREDSEKSRIKSASIGKIHRIESG